MRTLLIDNYDSFTYNIFHLLAEVNGQEPVVVRNDEAPWTALRQLEFENVVISPGPGRPDRPDDFGVCAEVIREASVPLLGICLGHQGIGQRFGASVAHAPEAMHGRVSVVYHDGSALFAGIPQGFQVVRYHSLRVCEPLPSMLESVAWADDGVVMGAAHRSRAIWGVQFHPESICTDWGRRLIANFRDLTRRVGSRERRRGTDRDERPALRRNWSPPKRPRLRLQVRRLGCEFDVEGAFVHLYGKHRYAFWLDSSLLDSRSRFSFIGGTGGPLSSVVAYDVAEGRVSVSRGLSQEHVDASIFDYLKSEVRRLRYVHDDLPFDLNCGFVGYLGYELKADCGGRLAHESGMPDATFLFADRVIAYDHYESCAYLVCLTEPTTEAEGERWLDETAERLEHLPAVDPVHVPEAAGEKSPPGCFAWVRPQERYLEDIERVKRYLAEGESYEVCLTNTLKSNLAPDPLRLYRTLRRLNPAPFSSFLRFGDLAVASSSPERFLHIGRDCWVEAKPIKGTCRRGSDSVEDQRLADELRSDEKNRAENLMITDLLRNDLGQVCETGTVHVPHLMAVESYETVHQLVSTVRGQLRGGLESPDAVRACFPGGSMTGAPKKRTMEIIDELEGEPRGVYSGAIGFFGLSGACDLSIVIRTVVMRGHETTIGAGGAIVTQSSPEAEYEEMLLKAHAPMEAVERARQEAAS